MNKYIKELIASVTREDGLLGLGKYGHEELEKLLIKVYRRGQRSGSIKKIKKSKVRICYHI